MTVNRLKLMDVQNICAVVETLAVSWCIVILHSCNPVVCFHKCLSVFCKMRIYVKDVK